MENAQTKIENPIDIGFEKVWATLNGIAEQQSKNEKLREELTLAQKETDLLLKETIKENNKRFGDVDNRFGDVIEAMITPGLLDKLYDMGLEFQTASPNLKVRDHKNKIYFEIDAFLENGDIAMLVEIKTNLTVHNVNEHIKRIEKMRIYSDLHKDSGPKNRRAFLGAVAGIVVPSEVKQYALENGLYVIEPSGENFNITTPNKEPRKW